MAQTFRDFIVECETFEYSQEFYEMMKESSTIKLMEQYLANQEFVNEYSESYKAEGIQFTEGYFFEADNAEATKNIKSELDGKKVGLGKRIIELVKKIWNSIKNFFIRIWDTITGNNQVEKRDRAAALLRDAGTAGGADQSEMKEKLKKIVDDADSKILAPAGVKISRKNRLSGDRGGNTLFDPSTNGDNMTSAKFAIALNTDKVTFEHYGAGEYPYPCSIETFIKAFDSFDAENVKSIHNVVSIISNCKENTKDGFTINALGEKKDYKANVKKINDIANKVNKTDASNADSETSGYIKDVVRVSGQIIKFYTAYYKYKLDVVNKTISLLAPIVRKGSTSKAKSDRELNAAQTQGSADDINH